MQDKNILSDLPMGFGMALAHNVPAMEHFSALPAAAQQRIIDGTHQVTSKKEMARYVQQLADGETGR